MSVQKPKKIKGGVYQIGDKVAVSVTNFASEFGVSSKTVRRAIDSGKLKKSLVQVGKRQFVFLEEGKAELGGATDPSYQMRDKPINQKSSNTLGRYVEESSDISSDEIKKKKAEIQNKVSTVSDDDTSEKVRKLYGFHRAQREKFDAKFSELKFLEKKGELVNKKNVEREAAIMASNLRENISSIPSKIANIIANESDPNKCEEILNEYISEALSKVAKVDIGSVIDDY